MTACSRCGAALEGFGVLHGMVASIADPDSGLIDIRILCYANGCRDAVLDGDVLHPADGECTRCGEPVERAPDRALLTTDIAPDDLPRMSTFCVEPTGCADVILTRANEGA